MFNLCEALISALIVCIMAQEDFLRLFCQDIKVKFHTVKLKHQGKVSDAQMKLLKQDAENQHAILSKKSASADDVSAASMSPHLSMHSTRGQEAGRGRHVKVQAVSCFLPFLIVDIIDRSLLSDCLWKASFTSGRSHALLRNVCAEICIPNDCCHLQVWYRRPFT